MKPIFFKNPAAFRKWLEKNAATEKEVAVGYYKVDTGKASITWSESVDQALCFGWIDGVRRSIDEVSYQIRFTPRKANSNWSLVNIRKMEELIRKGQVTEAGMQAYGKRREARSGVYSYEKEALKLLPAYETLFKKNKPAWKYFSKLSPGYRKTSIQWVMSAKQESTQLKRLQSLILDSEHETNTWKDNKYSIKKIAGK